MSAWRFIINAIVHRLTGKSVIVEYTTTNGTQVNMKAHRLMINRMTVILGFDFHIVLTSKGNVRRYSYAYQANRGMRNASGCIKLELTQCCDIYVVDQQAMAEC